MNDTTSPIWLTYDYRAYGETAQPFRQFHLIVSEKCDNLSTRLKLPPERIRDFFNQPSAVVLQEDDLLALLDEFLALIAVSGKNLPDETGPAEGRRITQRSRHSNS